MSDSSTEKPTLLVTGATGLVGSELTRQLVSRGFTVRIFRRKHSSLVALGGVAEEVEHAIGDLRDASSVLRAMDGVGGVMHVAAQLPGASAEVLQEINVRGTGNVVNAALELGISRLVHTSSIAALGRPARGNMIDENTSWREKAHRSAYARSKRGAELEVLRGMAEGLDAVIVNPGFIFGVGRKGENTRLIVDLVRRGWALVAPAGGTCFVDARDVADGLIRAYRLGETGERYILCGENLRWKEAIGRLADAFDSRAPRGIVPDWLALTAALLSEMWATVTRSRPGFHRSMARTMSTTYRYSNSKARNEIGCSFRSFDETARHIASHLSTNSG